MSFTLFTRLQVAVANANGSESSLGVSLDNVLNLLAGIILKGLNLALLVHERVASFKYGLPVVPSTIRSHWRCTQHLHGMSARDRIQVLASGIWQLTHVLH